VNAATLTKHSKERVECKNKKAPNMALFLLPLISSLTQ